ncbi:hypothetical protein SLEP1_g55945 [Rubroshorea leprosula]|uniref:Receptor-like protein 12 n=1 Tax=Rubroshorea leprosula TaxID=152421 RepID=A0AAV5ML78_9ROSI|nr:hypothetical protein SLEP1_g55945 [Rubroshorea leprosula]
MRGHVIGLDLSGNCLEANLTTNSSLFHLKKLQSLNLAYNDFSYPNLSFGFDRWKSLTYLNLSYSVSGFNHWKSLNYVDLSAYMNSPHLFDEIVLLPKLVSLDLSDNYGLLLDNIKFQILVHNLTELRFLVLDYLNMSLVVPSSLLNLTSSLKHLSLRSCNLQGNFPSQVFQLSSLQLLDLSNNSYLGDNLSESNLSSTLEYLNLDGCQFYGSIPDVFEKMHKLTHLSLFNNSFDGEIPTSIFNLANLTYLRLSSNKLRGPLPRNISGLSFLLEFRMDNNFIVGPVPSWLFSLPSLFYLDLKNNKLTGPIDHVEIPNLILQETYLSNNEISGFGNLKTVDLRFNVLQGSLPIPSTTWDSMQQLFISGNKLTGEIPSSYCNLTSLGVLDLANNSLGGKIPECLGNLSNLVFLDLRMNKFHGRIPNSFVNMNTLRTLNLNGNQLEGILPRSLVNCSKLEILDVGNNNLNDTFPDWLGVLQSLKVLILRSNGFHGAINNSMPAFYFHQLRIIDVAQNDFMDLLPSNYFKILNGMRNVTSVDKLEYIGVEQCTSDKQDIGNQCYPNNEQKGKPIRCTPRLCPPEEGPQFYYEDYVEVVVKGFKRKLVRILEIFTTIDFSSNQFHGPIPEELGELNLLRGLNLSHNSLTRQIPSSLGKLAELESLDLSSNKLEGGIPEQLTNLTFLSVLHLSHNKLVGHIPEGKQFSTFSNDSYIGNSGLCGFPLTKNCHEEEEPGAPPKFDEEDESATLFEWKFALAGYGCGLVLGLSLGYIAFTTGKPWWVVKKVEKYQQKLIGRCNQRHKKRKTQKPNQHC